MKQIAGAKNIQTLRHAMILAQEGDIKLKSYEGLNDIGPSVMQNSAVPHSKRFGSTRANWPVPKHTKPESDSGCDCT